MGKWYNEAVFYHMYPLGMTGAPKENKEPETACGSCFRGSTI